MKSINRKRCQNGELPASPGTGWAAFIKANRGHHQSCYSTVRRAKNKSKPMHFAIDDGD